MTVHIGFPKLQEDALRKAWGDLDRAATEALIIESYRLGKLSLGEVAEFLNLDTLLEARRWLAERHVVENYGLEELESDRATLRQLSWEKT